ncbi:fasciclin domain-containing protein [Planktothrix sp. FACHB-1365]|uniref:fasciclin domain-containing protein n=1 Tax=Planktothrix sp. FACHB-1365 TaxID=2692855 RepID=UPI00168879C2|nr:fasciclin domain-containing protein [Planktothrix sp. FACHB-1365]MBD2480879.1 fasciclin domain-containing protein [Planktothrix sp. FACHB-1365]
MAFNRFYTHSIAVLGIASLGFLAQVPAKAQMQSPDSGMQNSPQMQQNMGSSQNILSVANSNGQYNTFIQAVRAAGLENILTGEGSYTVFAPTDEAFASLPTGTLERLMQPENKEVLKQVLSYHVIEGEVPSNQMADGSIDSLGGGLAVRVAPDRVIVNNASVVQPDIEATNGLIHGINRVLMPTNLQNSLSQNSQNPQQITQFDNSNPSNTQDLDSPSDSQNVDSQSERVNPQQRNNSSSDRMNNSSPSRTEQEIFDVDSPSDLRDVDSQSERVNPRQQPQENNSINRPMNSNPSSNQMNQQDSDNNSQPSLIDPHSPTDSQPGFPGQM